MLDPQQQARALEVMREYLAAPKGPDGVSPVSWGEDLDRKRRELIDGTLKPIVAKFLAGQLPLPQFKTQMDSLNKRNEFWGFKGPKGQMFFNQLTNSCSNPEELAQELKVAIAAPLNDDMAGSRILTFASYVKRVGNEHVESGGSVHGRPKVSSVPFFLSYFWQVQARDRWPVYYTNAVQTLTDLNVWRETDDLAPDYISFCRLHQDLVQLFSKASGQPWHLYDIEHVFWYKGKNPYSEAAGAAGNGTTSRAVAVLPTKGPSGSSGIVGNKLPESYVPPIVAMLPQMAVNDPAVAELAKASGTSIDRAFEKSIHAAFTILGFDTKLLGQGQGRVPDGLALDHDNLYAIIWDAKVRAGGYSIGTDDRAIREYITTQSRELKRRKGLRNVYYVIVSSTFAEDYDDTIRSLKMETDVSEVCLIEATALVALVEQRLRNPREVPLGPDGIQPVFSSSGVIDAEVVASTLT